MPRRTQYRTQARADEVGFGNGRQSPLPDPGGPEVRTGDRGRHTVAAPRRLVYATVLEAGSEVIGRTAMA